MVKSAVFAVNLMGCSALHAAALIRPAGWPRNASIARLIRIRMSRPSSSPRASNQVGALRRCVWRGGLLNLARLSYPVSPAPKKWRLLRACGLRHSYPTRLVSARTGAFGSKIVSTTDSPHPLARIRGWIRKARRGYMLSEHEGPGSARAACVLATRVAKGRYGCEGRSGD